MNVFIASRAAASAAGVALALLFTTSAYGDVAAAAAAFQKAQAAELNKDHVKAAEFYELADRLSPAAAALRGAIRMRLVAKEYALAATHAENLLRRHPDDPNSRRTAEHVLEELQPRVARVSVTCDAPCRLVVDDKVVTVEPGLSHAIYVSPGRHAVAAAFESGTTDAQSVSGTSGGRVSVVFKQPATQVPEVIRADDVDSPPERSLRRLSPWYFGGAAVVTAALGAFALWSGLDVISKHDDYDRSAPDAQERYEDGQDREKRTNILIGFTAGAAAATVVLALFTDWSSSSEESQSQSAPRGAVVGFLPHGVGVSYAASW